MAKNQNTKVGTSAVDRVLILSAKNFPKYVVDLAKKGSSSDARNRAAKIYCDWIVGEAHERYEQIINGDHNVSSARFILDHGLESIKQLSEIGLSQKTKDYILQRYLSVGIYGEAFHVAELGVSAEALNTLREEMIRGGEPHYLVDVAQIQGKPLVQGEIDSLALACLEKGARSKVLSQAIDAVKLGASKEVRERIANAYIEIRNTPESFGYRWGSLIEILDGYPTYSKEFLNPIATLFLEKMKLLISNEDTYRNKSDYRTSINDYVCGLTRIVNFGVSEHIADFCAQELVALGIWKKINVSVIASHCSKSLMENWLCDLLLILQGDNFRHWHKEGQMKFITDVARIAERVKGKNGHRVIHILLCFGLLDEAIHLSAVMKNHLRSS